MGGRYKGGRQYTGRIVIRLQKNEWEKLERKVVKSTCWTMSMYCRKVLLGQPVTLLYRNQSLDELLGEVIRIRKSLQLLPREDGATGRVLEEIKNCLTKIYEYVCQNTP